MHFKCNQCPAEFCSGCGDLFKKVVPHNHVELLASHILCNLHKKCY